MTHNMSLSAWARGGILQREMAIYRRLAGDLDQISFVSYGSRSDSELLGEEPNMKVLTNWIKVPPRVYSHLAPLIHARDLRSADVFKTNQFDGALTALRAKRIFRKPLIVRGGYIWSVEVEHLMGESSQLAAQTRRTESRVLHAADRVVVTDQHKVELIKRKHNIDPSKIVVIPNYVDTELFSPADPTGTADDGRTITYVGRLEPQKMPAILLEAARDLDVNLIFIGGGAERAELEHRAASARANVEFRGTMPSHEIAKQLNKSTLFVMPTKWEGQPKALLESMSAGVPVISSEVTGVVDLIDDGVNGVMVPNDPRDFQDAIVRLLDDNILRSRLGKAGRQYVIDHNSIDLVQSLELNLYRELTS